MSVFNPITLQSYTTSQILSRTVSVTVTPVVDAVNPHKLNWSTGGLLVFNNILGPQKSGLVQNLTVTTKSTQSITYKFYLLTDNPSSSTIKDLLAVTFNTADLPKLVDVITLGSADSTLTSTINVTDNIGRSVVAPTSTLYGILINTSPVTYTSTNDVSITLTVIQD